MHIGDIDRRLALRLLRTIYEYGATTEYSRVCCVIVRGIPTSPIRIYGLIAHQPRWKRNPVAQPLLHILESAAPQQLNWWWM